MTPRKSPAEPQIVEMPPLKMAVVSGKGAPDKVFPRLMPALYGAVYNLRFDRKKKGLPVFKVSGLRARYPDAPLVPKEEWAMVVGLPIPEDTTSLLQKDPEVAVRIENWQYGTVAQILHIGAYSEETANIERLLQFIKDNGYEVAGPHEEEYVTRPDAQEQKTIIRYQVRKR
jgi:hypothetical protein